MNRKKEDEIVRLSDFDVNEEGELKIDNTEQSTSDDTLGNNLGMEKNGDEDGGEVSKGIGNKKVRKGKKYCVIIVWVGIVLLLVVGYGLYGYQKYQDAKIIKATSMVIYDDAIALYKQKKYADAIDKLSGIEEFGDSREKIKEIQEVWNSEIYDKADTLYDTGEYEGAIELFASLAESDYLDSKDRLDEVLDIQRKEYISLLGSKLYKINKYKDLTSSVGAIVVDTWKKNRDKTDKEVSDKIAQVFKDRANDLRHIDIGFKGLEQQLGEIVKLGGAEKAYDGVMSLYEKYKVIHENVINPIGEFKDYEKKMKEYSAEFDIELERLYVIEPGLRDAYKMEEELDMEKELKSGKQVIESKDD